MGANLVSNSIGLVLLGAPEKERKGHRWQGIAIALCHSRRTHVCRCATIGAAVAPDNDQSHRWRRVRLGGPNASR